MALRETDILTGLYTPGYLIAYGARELVNAHENGYPVSVISVKIPNLPNILAATDRTSSEFIEISGMIKRIVGNTAMISRTDDTEFAILLPNVDSVKAAGIAYKLKRILRKNFENEVFSIGVASDFGQTNEINDLIKAARKAMHESEHSGILKIT